MNPRELIRQAANTEEYFVTAHCLAEMDKDGLSVNQVAQVMADGSEKKVTQTQRMDCSCGTAMVDKRVSVERSVAGRKVTITNVPALSCPQCGNTLYRASVVRTMDALIRDHAGQDTVTYPKVWTSAR